MMFDRHDRIRHVRTGKDYVVLLTPEHLRIEGGNKPAYAYQALWNGMDRTVWVRSQGLMEDGRFELVMHTLAAADGRLP